MNRYDTIIVGGGITGLAAAYRLKKLDPNRRIAILEATSLLGGKLETERWGGFVLEGGPDCFLSRKPRGVGLCEELGIADELVGRLPLPEGGQRAYVKRHGQLHPLPEGLTGLVPTNLEALEASTLLSDDGKARVAEEPSIPAAQAGQDESVAAFVSRRLGRETYENIVEPLMSGIYAGDGDQLSLNATFPQLKAIEQKHGSLLNGLTKPTSTLNGTDKVEKYPPFVSFEKGMGYLVDKLIDALDGVDIFINSPVIGLVQHETGGWMIEVESAETPHFEARTLLLTTPAFVNAKLLAAPLPHVADEMAAIPYVGTVLVNISINAENLTLPAGYGYVIPRAEKRNVLACTWTSQKWDKRAPEGKLLIRVYLGRHGEDDVVNWPDHKLIGLARQELEETLGLAKSIDIKMMYIVNRWPNGLPQYTMGHVDRLKRIDAAVDQVPTLFVAGASYRGVGIPDCIHSGEQAAEKIVQS